MMRSLYLKTLYDKRWFCLGWFIGFGFLAFLMSIFYPAMNQEGALDALVTQMPPALQGMVGDLANLREFSTYLASQLFDIRVGILGGVMVIILGLGLTVAEEEKGELRTLAALPISRSRIVLHKFLAMISIIAITLLGMIPGIMLGQFLIDETLPLDVLARLLAMNWLLLLALGSIVFATGLATGKRSLTMTISIIVVAGGFILSTFSQAVEWLQPFEVISLLHYFPSVEIAKTSIAISDSFVLAAVTLVAYAIAVVFLRIRDIR
ncbi:MAG: ABC transporter permease subunit [Candidatus Saccharimonadales bacterium]